jgi:hypothetical protein
MLNFPALKVGNASWVHLCYPVDMKDPEKPESASESTESRIRRERKFSLAEAIGREAAGTLKGASPVALGRQALFEIEHLLESQLPDPEGSLTRTLMAKLQLDPPLLARHFERPAGALTEYLTITLGKEALLNALVRDTDARWGRENQERPHFEREGQPPHPDDPYTRAGVREMLEDLLSQLESA